MSHVTLVSIINYGQLFMPKIERVKPTSDSESDSDYGSQVISYSEIYIVCSLFLIPSYFIFNTETVQLFLQNSYCYYILCIYIYNFFSQMLILNYYHTAVVVVIGILVVAETSNGLLPFKVPEKVFSIPRFLGMRQLLGVVALIFDAQNQKKETTQQVF